MRIELQQLSARHPVAQRSAAPALQDITLTIAAGEQVAVIGPSGAGKTTLLHVLACALKPAQGRLLLDTADPWSLPVRSLQALRKRLFLAPQTPPLPPRQRVVTAALAARLPQWSLWQSLRSLAYPFDASAAQHALAQFDLADKLWQRVDRLSGGERQRVGLARALLSPAALWLVDEPLSALDPARAQQALAALLRNARERGLSVVASLHQVDLAVQSFPRVIGMRDGHMAFDLPSAQVTRARLAQLYAQHEHELIAAPALLTADAAAPSAASAPIGMICR